MYYPFQNKCFVIQRFSSKLLKTLRELTETRSVELLNFELSLLLQRYRELRKSQINNVGSVINVIHR